MEASGLTKGPIFRRLWKDRIGPALTPHSVAQILQRRARKLPPEVEKSLSGSSAFESIRVLDVLSDYDDDPRAMAQRHRRCHSALAHRT